MMSALMIQFHENNVAFDPLHSVLQNIHLEILWHLNKLCLSLYSYHNCVKGSPATLLKKRPWHRRFLLNFAKYLRTLFLYNTSGLVAASDSLNAHFCC